MAFSSADPARLQRTSLLIKGRRPVGATGLRGGVRRSGGSAVACNNDFSSGSRAGPAASLWSQGLVQRNRGTISGNFCATSTWEG
jgi:hypothetical protein